jgi:hypothetical protein
MQIRRPGTLGILLSITLIVGAAAASFATPRSHTSAAAQDTSSHLRAPRTTASRTARQLAEVTSTNRHTACKRDCEEKYFSCVTAKKTKGWDDDRAERICGLAARTCKGGCDRR